MRKLIGITLVITVILCSCKKEVVTDLQSKMSAKINAGYLSANDAVALLEKSSFFSGKGQLTLTGEDDKNKIVVTMKDYASETKVYTLPNPLINVLITNKTSGVSDTALNGQLDIKIVTTNYYSFTTLPVASYATGQLYKSEIIGGSFEFTTGNGTQVTNGVFGISFNK